MILIRQALEDLKLQETLDNAEIINDAISYFNRQDDHEQIRTAIKKRYDVGVKSVKNPGEGTGVTETYVRGHLTTQVDSGQIENFSIGFAPKIVGALATLFTEKGQKFTLSHETVENLETAETLLFEDNRNASNFDSTITDIDKLSVQIGSAANFIEFNRGRLSYKKFSPAEVRPYFNDYVVEEGKTRSVDRTDIEDATAIVLHLGTNDNINWNYLAIYGRSEIYPDGRYVQFKGPQTLTRIPEPYADGAIEHEIDGEIANPLTWWGNQEAQKDKDIPEYPIVIFKGGTTDSNDAMPVSTSLYDAAIGFDIDASHLESTSQKAAAGTRALTRTHEAMGNPIPPTLSGDISLTEGQDVKVVDHDSQASKDGMEIAEQNMLHCASGYGVPDYMIIPRERSLTAESGIALAIKTAPLIKKRDYRIKLNRPAVKKLFTIEKAYIGIHAVAESDAKEADVQLLLECEQNWDPGEISLPENKSELTTRLIAAKNAGMTDEIESIRVFHEMGSDEEAITFYEKMAERAAKYPPLKPEKKKAVGLPGRTQATEL
jgi:hypothetical protein